MKTICQSPFDLHKKHTTDAGHVTIMYLGLNAAVRPEGEGWNILPTDARENRHKPEAVPTTTSRIPSPFTSPNTGACWTYRQLLRHASIMARSRHLGDGWMSEGVLDDAVLLGIPQ